MKKYDKSSVIVSVLIVAGITASTAVFRILRHQIRKEAQVQKLLEENRHYFLAMRRNPIQAVLQVEINPGEKEKLGNCSIARLEYDTREKGLPTREALIRIHRFEDSFELKMIEGDGFHAGHNLQDGLAIVVGYSNKAMPKSMIFEGKSIPIETKHDPEWKLFKQYLGLTDYEKHYSDNRDLLGSLKESGDDHSIPRVVDFFAYFQLKTQRAKFMAAIAKKGFQVQNKSVRSPEPRVHEVTFQKKIAIEPDKMASTTAEIEKVCTSFGGTFDGWESPVEEGK